MNYTTETDSQQNPIVVQPTFRPRRKVMAGGITGALVSLVVLTLNTYVLIGPQANKKIPAELATAATTVLTFLVSYMVPPGTDEDFTEDENGNIKSALKH